MRKTALELVWEAVEKTGKTDLFSVTQYLEDEMRKSKGRLDEWYVWKRLARLGIRTTGDVQALIRQVR